MTLEDVVIKYQNKSSFSDEFVRKTIEDFHTILGEVTADRIKILDDIVEKEYGIRDSL